MVSNIARRVAARYLVSKGLDGKVRLRTAQQEQEQEQTQGQGEEGGEETYGGKGPFNLPPDHIAAMPVPKGGACCAKCKFVDVENHACLEPNYVTWNGGDTALPDLPLDEICSDWFVAGPATGAEGQSQGQGQEQGDQQ
jgi:hypothetical protein